jgi:hypothetical protein
MLAGNRLAMNDAEPVVSAKDGAGTPLSGATLFDYGD